jgi:hypothetical protein
MKILYLIVIILLIILAITLAGGLLVMLSYGAGWLLTRFLALSTFEATLLSLIAISVIGITGARILGGFFAPPAFPTTLGEDEDEESEEEPGDDEDTIEEDDQPYKGRNVVWKKDREYDFSGVKPDDRCPCGSGRKYKNCHGRRHLTTRD